MFAHELFGQLGVERLELSHTQQMLIVNDGDAGLPLGGRLNDLQLVLILLPLDLFLQGDHPHLQLRLCVFDEPHLVCV